MSGTLPSVAIGVWVIFYLDDSILNSAWLNDGEKKLLADNIARLNLDPQRIIPIHLPADNRKITMSELMIAIGKKS